MNYAQAKYLFLFVGFDNCENTNNVCCSQTKKIKNCLENATLDLPKMDLADDQEIHLTLIQPRISVSLKKHIGSVFLDLLKEQQYS